MKVKNAGSAVKTAKPEKSTSKKDNRPRPDSVESIRELYEAPHKPNTGKTDDHRRAIADYLNKLLADEHVIYVKTRNYHWNIEGPNFMEMHKLLEGIYTELAEVIDEIAERVRKVGHYAQGSMKDFIANASLQENEYTTKQRQQLGFLLEDHEYIIRELDKMVKKFDDEYEDAGTADFVTGLMEKHEKWAWFLRSYLN